MDSAGTNLEVHVRIRKNFTRVIASYRYRLKLFKGGAALEAGPDAPVDASSEEAPQVLDLILMRRAL